MRDKISSFQMSSQFNGHGDTVYLKADTVKIPPVDQDNITLTPDYSQYALYAVGGVPVVLDPQNIDIFLNRMLGARSALNQVILTKGGPGGGYAATFRIATRGFTDGSYPTIRNRSNRETKRGEIDYFAVTQKSNLNIRKARSESAEVLGSVKPGATFKVITMGGKIVKADDDLKKAKWVKATNGTVEGWVSETYIREDKKGVLLLSRYGLDGPVEVTVTFDGGKMSSTKAIPSKQWCMVGGGEYSYPCKKVDGKWCVAVGPAVMDLLYPRTGKCFAEDMIPFSKFIKVNLRHMSTNKMITEEFCICDIKAHTFDRFPYSDTEKSTIDVKRIEIDPRVPPGMMQTGIRYMNAENPVIVAPGNIDFSIIEFCGNSMSDRERFKEYELISIETNYDKSTRGKIYDYSTGKERVIKEGQTS